MTKAISSRTRRTYFNNPLVEESLQHLGAAVDHPTSLGFRQYLENHLHHNSQKTRGRFAQYISQRFSHDGVMNRDLARAIAQFGDSRVGREILYFEMLRATPLLQEIASSWLSQVPAQGVARQYLLSFLEPRLGGRSADQVAQAAVATFRRCGKLTSPKPAVYIPVWAEPPIEAFCYVLALLYPDPTMVMVDLFAGQPVLRAMLWPHPAFEGLLKQAEQLGHISKISQLDQYHQFTLAGGREERLGLLLQAPNPTDATPPTAEPPTPLPVEAAELADTTRPAGKRRPSKKPAAAQAVTLSPQSEQPSPAPAESAELGQTPLRTGKKRTRASGSATQIPPPPHHAGQAVSVPKQPAGVVKTPRPSREQRTRKNPAAIQTAAPAPRTEQPLSLALQPAAPPKTTDADRKKRTPKKKPADGTKPGNDDQLRLFM